MKSLLSGKNLRLTLALVGAVALLLVVILSASLWAAPGQPALFGRAGLQQVQAAADAPKAELKAAEQSAPANGGAWLGLMVANADGGAKVVQVLPDSPAIKAGAQKDDLITAVNGAAVANASDVVTTVHKQQPGDKITLTIKRNNQEMQIAVTSGTAPAPPQEGHSLGSRNLPPDLQGLQGTPPREWFDHFTGSTVQMKDKDGKDITINMIPGTVLTASTTALTITPNGGGPARDFQVDSNTAVYGFGRTTVQNLKAGTKVIVVTVGTSTHAAIVARAGLDFNPLDGVMPHMPQLPRLWGSPPTAPGAPQFHYFNPGSNGSSKPNM